LSRKNIDIGQVETIPATRQTSDFGISMIVQMLLVLALIVALVGGIGLMGALWIGVIERTKEIGVMRAIGAVTRTLLGMFVLEGMIQGILSWVLAVPLALLVTPWVSTAMGRAIFQSIWTTNSITGLPFSGWGLSW
jgi:putative ABC transport system permease protein